jgi:hypothetical protein
VDHGCRTPSRAEEVFSRQVRAVLAPIVIGESIPSSSEFTDLLVALEYFIPEVIEEIHQEWKGIGLDGVVPIRAKKTAEREIEIIGFAYVFRREPWSPVVHLRARVSEFKDELSSFACRIGERGVAGDSQSRPPAIERKAALLALDANAIDWAYAVAFGEDAD